MIFWIIGFISVSIILYLLDREIYRYEGINIGPRLQAWLYDRWAEKYDHDKRDGQARDVEMLAKPLLAKISNIPHPLILDVATGTGRLPFAVSSQPEFKGHIIAIDISHGMLKQAAKKLSPQHERVELVQYETFPLPFPDQTFDVVSCVEALELIGDKQAAVNELARVLRPGGILLTTRGTEESGRGHVVVSAEALTMLLQNAGFADVEITPWWRVFNRVFARKPGILEPAGKISLKNILRCLHCGVEGVFSAKDADLHCQNCSKQITVDGNGIVLYS